MKNHIAFILITLIVNVCTLRGEERIDTDATSLIINRTSDSQPVHKGEFFIGLAASFGKVTTENSEMLLLFDGIEAKGNTTTINPSFGYFYNDHSAAGVRFKYMSISGAINSASLDLGSSNDIDFNIPYVGVESTLFSYGLFQRSYAKLDTKGQFELFSELELLYTNGSTNISHDLSGAISTVRNKSNSYSINFNPGLSVYLFPNVATHVSLGLGGISYSKVKQYDGDGKFIGEHSSSGLNLKINLFAVNIGFAVHIW